MISRERARRDTAAMSNAELADYLRGVVTKLIFEAEVEFDGRDDAFVLQQEAVYEAAQRLRAMT